MAETLNQMTIADGDLQAVLAARRANDVNFLDAYSLPQLPEPDMQEVYERLQEAERQNFSPTLLTSGYKDGTAVVPDQLLIVDGQRLLITAEHATDRVNIKPITFKRLAESADHGTGALAVVVSEDVGSHLIAPIGLQTGNANKDLKHPLKDAMRPVLEQSGTIGHLSLHGMFMARAENLADMRGYNIILGIGEHPSDETKDAVDKALEIARKYDLRAGVNQTVTQFGAARLEDGSRKTITLAAKGAGTTRYTAQQTAETLGKPLATMQIEISAAQRLLPEDNLRYPGATAQRIGSYLGYRFVRECAELFAPVSPESGRE